MADEKTHAKGAELLRLHQDPSLLTVVNVWDVISARVVADVDGTTALATASHSIAASLRLRGRREHPGRPDARGGRGGSSTATDLPVTADLEGGYGNAAETVRRGHRPRRRRRQHRGPDEAAGRGRPPGRGDHEGRRARRASTSCSTPAPTPSTSAATRTRRTTSRRRSTRGKAYLDAGAPVVFVPGDPQRGRGADAGGRLRPAAADDDRDPRQPAAGAARGARRRPGLVRPAARRTSPSPRCQELVEEAHRGGGVPKGTRFLN